MHTRVWPNDATTKNFNSTIQIWDRLKQMQSPVAQTRDDLKGQVVLVQNHAEFLLQIYPKDSFLEEEHRGFDIACAFQRKSEQSEYRMACQRGMFLIDKNFPCGAVIGEKRYETARGWVDNLELFWMDIFLWNYPNGMTGGDFAEVLGKGLTIPKENRRQLHVGFFDGEKLRTFRSFLTSFDGLMGHLFYMVSSDTNNVIGARFELGVEAL